MFALTIALGLRYLGVLLMGSLIIVPTAKQLSESLANAGHRGGDGGRRDDRRLSRRLLDAPADGSVHRHTRRGLILSDVCAASGIGVTQTFPTILPTPTMESSQPFDDEDRPSNGICMPRRRPRGEMTRSDGPRFRLASAEDVPRITHARPPDQEARQRLVAILGAPRLARVPRPGGSAVDDPAQPMNAPSDRFVDIAILWADGDVSCRLAIDGTRYRVSVECDGTTVASEVCVSAARALTVGASWQSTRRPTV